MARYSKNRFTKWFGHRITIEDSLGNITIEHRDGRTTHVSTFDELPEVIKTDAAMVLMQDEREETELGSWWRSSPDVRPPNWADYQTVVLKRYWGQYENKK